jgi:GDP-L-fucose synthase
MVMSNAYISKSDCILITGSKGLLGYALEIQLKLQGYTNVVTTSRDSLDLTEYNNVFELISTVKPRSIIHCAAVVGGILANIKYPTRFIIENILISANLFKAAHLLDVENILAFGSNCMYPSDLGCSLSESLLGSGHIESTNMAYGVSKLATYAITDSYKREFNKRYIFIIPASLYGPNDQFNDEYSHFCSALIKKFHVAKITNSPQVKLWGDGTPRRELLYSYDAAQGVIKILESYDSSLGPINLGTGTDSTISEVAHTIKDIIQYDGEVVFDLSKPNGTHSKLLNSDKFYSQFNLDITSLENGIRSTYDWFSNSDSIRN